MSMSSYDGPRACRPLELAPVLDLINLVFRTGRAGAPTGRPTMGWDYTHIYHPDNLENVRVIIDQGRPVCSIGIYSNTVRTPRGEVSVGGINAVATHPDYRRRGLASATLEDAHARMRALGHEIAILGTRIPDWYRKLGWEYAGQQRRYVFDRGNITFLPDSAGMEVTEEWRSDVDALCALHNAEPLGAPRTPALFRLLVERKLRRVFVARRDGNVVAYAGVRDASVREYGGEPTDAAALLRAVFTALDDVMVRTSERPPGRRPTIGLTVVTPATADGLPGLLQARGIPCTLACDGMIKILDAPGLFETLELRAVSLDRRGGGWTLRYDRQTLDVTERELVKLVFGPERFSGFAPGIFPVAFYQWPLDHV